MLGVDGYLHLWCAWGGCLSLLLFFLQSRHSETIVVGCIYSQALARKLSERLVPRGVGAGIRKNLESRINVLERIVEVERISN